MSNIRKELPHWIDSVWRQSDKGVVNQYGIYEMFPPGYIGERFIRSQYNDLRFAPFYCDIENYPEKGDDVKCLTFNAIFADESGFYAEQVGCLWFNQYHELEGEAGVNIYDDIYGRGIHTGAARAFCLEEFSKLDFYESSNELFQQLSTQAPLEILKIFLEKKHKILPLFIKEGKTEFINDILVGNSKGYERTTRKALTLTENWNIGLTTAISLCDKYNPQEVDKFCSMLNYFGMNAAEIITWIDDNMVLSDFTEFANYIVRNIIIYGQIEISPRVGLSMMAFLRDYCDYIIMINAEDNDDKEYYPTDLEVAHAAVVERRDFMYNKPVYDSEAFKKATDKYKELEWVYPYGGSEYDFVVPETPDDLIQEGRSMHHCVGLYIQRVIDEKTKIVCVKKDKKPYMTIEIGGSDILQAKRKCNELPDDDDARIIRKFAKTKGLEIIRY